MKPVVPDRTNGDQLAIGDTCQYAKTAESYQRSLVFPFRHFQCCFAGPLVSTCFLLHQLLTREDGLFCGVGVLYCGDLKRNQVDKAVWMK